MNTVEYLTKTYGSPRSVDDLSLVRPGRLSRPVIVSVRSIIAEIRFGLRPLTRVRRTPRA